jgi:HSP20 family protein
MDDFFRFPSLFGDEGSGFTPRVNIREDEDHVWMTFEIPGMSKEDIKVSMQNNVLTVSGSREEKSKSTEKNYVRTEISTGSFRRSFNLPEQIDPDSIEAEYKNGMLEVRLNKREETKPKQIDVKVS